MFYELIPLLIFLGILLTGGIALIADAGVRVFRDIHAHLTATTAAARQSRHGKQWIRRHRL